MIQVLRTSSNLHNNLIIVLAKILCHPLFIPYQFPRMLVKYHQ